MLKRKQVFKLVTIVGVFFLIGTMFNFIRIAIGGGNTPWDEVWAAISELQTKVENLEARIEALESQTEIKIVAYPTTDYYMRSHGLSVDEPLPDQWWLYGYEFKVAGSEFTYVKSVTLESGSHYVEYASSGYVYELDLAWHAEIYINDILKAEGDVGRDSPLRAYFDIGD